MTKVVNRTVYAEPYRDWYSIHWHEFTHEKGERKCDYEERLYDAYLDDILDPRD